MMVNMIDLQKVLLVIYLPEWEIPYRVHGIVDTEGYWMFG